jgi:alanyl-tRNA synthetase
VDTGMGLERLAAVLQHVHSNYEIDLFQRLIGEAARLTGTADLENKSLRVIADHIRACSFLIVDGVLPSNEGRGYVLRRIIRRALRHGWMLGQKQPFFHAMVPALVEVMGEAYPELPAKRELVEAALLKEEQRFSETLENGMKLLDSVFKDATHAKVVPGRIAFTLYDTYGFPVDLTADIAREHGWSVDMAGFEAAMNEQRERARSASQFDSKVTLPAEVASALPPTRFLGYQTLVADGAQVLAIVQGGRAVGALAEGEEGVVILDQTPFYAESGGQVGDVGVLADATTRFDVRDTIKLGGVFHAHVGRVRGGALKVGMAVDARVDAARRQATVLNHSATHLLHAALREVLGTHVQQKGSLVAPDRLRFDFSHTQPIATDELRRIEDLVNAEIRRNAVAEVHEMGYQDALEFGALALFGEKYGDHVRVLKMGEFSTELCGGTHVGRTGDIGLFKIVSESGVAAGVRRIEAVTGAAAIAFVADEEARLDEIGALLSAPAAEVVDKLRQVFERQKKLERELESLKAKAASSATQDLAAAARKVGDVSIVAARVDGLDAKALREGIDTLKQKLGDCVVLLAAGADGKVALVGGVHGAALGRVKAGEIVAHVAAQIGGKGGGRPDMAQGGGVDSPALDTALAALPEWIAARMG